MRCTLISSNFGINANDDEHIWAEDYDRDLTDVFDIQTDLAQKIAYTLQAKLSSNDNIAVPLRGVPPVFLKSLKEKRSLLEAQPLGQALTACYSESCWADKATESPTVRGIARLLRLLRCYYWMLVSSMILAICSGKEEPLLLRNIPIP
jgi:hypothetical protein